MLFRCPVLVLAAMMASTVGAGAASDTARTWQSVTAIDALLHTTNRVWDGDSLSLSNHQHALRFYAGRRRCEIDGTVVWLHAPFEAIDGSNDWRLGADDLTSTIEAILTPAAPPLPPAPCVVVLDPGHGGEDSGASSPDQTISERTFTFDLALRISNLLARADLPVVLTRTADQFVPLEERSQMAARVPASVFVSLHANFAANSGACGIETYAVPFAGRPGSSESTRADPFCDGNRFDAANARLGYAIHSRLAPLALTDRGFKRARFAVLRQAPCPAVLVECGFLSHTNDARLLIDPAYRDLLATAIADGIIAFCTPPAAP